jgi:hypothetical protein
MRRQLPAEALARDERFVRRTLEDRLSDPRLGGRAAPAGSAQGKGVASVRGRFDRDRPGAPDQARVLMHGRPSKGLVGPALTTTPAVARTRSPLS